MVKSRGFLKKKSIKSITYIFFGVKNTEALNIKKALWETPTGLFFGQQGLKTYLIP